MSRIGVRPVELITPHARNKKPAVVQFPSFQPPPASSFAKILEAILNRGRRAVRPARVRTSRAKLAALLERVRSL